MWVLGHVPYLPRISSRYHVKFVIMHGVDHANRTGLLFVSDHPQDRKQFLLQTLPDQFAWQLTYHGFLQIPISQRLSDFDGTEKAIRDALIDVTRYGGCW